MLKRLLGFSMSTWVGAILTFALLPLASYIYPQEELGVINYYYSVINIVFTVILLGLDQGYIRFFPEIKDKKSKRSFIFYQHCGDPYCYCHRYFTLFSLPRKNFGMANGK